MSGDEEGFADFVAARTAALSRTAYLLCGNHHDAEDLVQVTMFKAARWWWRIKSSPEPYVRKVLYHEFVSQVRRRGSRPPEHLTNEFPEGSADAAADPSTRLTLAAALARLTPRQRTVLVLRFYEDLSESQTAAAMGTGIGTVKSQTRHALTRLREIAPEVADLAEALD